MKLAWLTDIHLNFLNRDQRQTFYAKIKSCGVQAAVVTGDISEGPELSQHLLEFAASFEAPIYFVLGNHDYYHSSIPKTRAEIRRLQRKNPVLQWMPERGVVGLSDKTALIGHGGWGDGQWGDFEAGKVMLNDYLFIKELKGRSIENLKAQLAELGQEAAQEIRNLLAAARSSYNEVIILTHVPPFPAACLYEGRISNKDWLPHFTCKAVGEMLLEECKAHPMCHVEVLCGHTHHAADYQALPNLRVRTGAAEYGLPAIADILQVE